MFSNYKRIATDIVANVGDKIVTDSSLKPVISTEGHMWENCKKAKQIGFPIERLYTILETKDRTIQKFSNFDINDLVLYSVYLMIETMQSTYTKEARNGGKRCTYLYTYLPGNLHAIGCKRWSEAGDILSSLMSIMHTQHFTISPVWGNSPYLDVSFISKYKDNREDLYTETIPLAYFFGSTSSNKIKVMFDWIMENPIKHVEIIN